jgi:hypothetical protein
MKFVEFAKKKIAKKLHLLNVTGVKLSVKIKVV